MILHPFSAILSPVAVIPSPARDLLFLCSAHALEAEAAQAFCLWWLLSNPQDAHNVRADGLNRSLEADEAKGCLSMKAEKRLPNVISAVTARAHFGQLLRRVTQDGELFLVTWRGEPQVIIMSTRDYLNIIRKRSRGSSRMGRGEGIKAPGRRRLSP